MGEGREVFPSGAMPLAMATELYVKAKAEGQLCPTGAYDSLFWHAADRDLTVEELIWNHEGTVPPIQRELLVD